jgi:hypothetical protein
MNTDFNHRGTKNTSQVNNQRLGTTGALLTAAILVGAFASDDALAQGKRARHHDCGGDNSAVPLTPDPSGRVEASTNALGVEGEWRVYADSYTDGRPPGGCQAAGHADAECSLASLPDSSVPGFPNVGGQLCTTGSTAVVLTVDGQLDWGHMWGIGIGLGFTGAAGTFDADAHGVVGIAFDVDAIPSSGLRVEFPTPSDSVGFGASYWGADEFYPSSPVQVGTNVVLFRDVQSPDVTAPPFDRSQIQQIGFLVPSNPAVRIDFSYCISNIRLLLE